MSSILPERPKPKPFELGSVFRPYNTDSVGRIVATSKASVAWEYDHAVGVRWSGPKADVNKIGYFV